ncbi:hypothetical protein [Sulfurospirillum sp.]|uniref:hypothetical protein n=1 Tax=Sulfurospirillum sp. TaxID=2053622 RepID=UPI002FDDEBF9
MLSTLEIIELEKKVLKYRCRQRLPYYIVASLMLLIAIASSFFYFASQSVITSKEVQSSKIQNDEKPIDTNLSITEQPSLPTQIQNSTKYTHEQNKTEDALFLQLPLIGKNNLEKKGASLPEILEIPETKTNINIQEEELDNRVLIRKTTQMSEKQIDPLLLPPPPLEEDKPKGFIKIETQEVNSIKYLKERFDKSHNIIFALMLADEYYIAKNYQESNKWAIIANTIDADNEKSWILFAKSKVKLGRKEDAISALEAYLKNNKANKVVQSVLNRILSGENID